MAKCLTEVLNQRNSTVNKKSSTPQLTKNQVVLARVFTQDIIFTKVIKYDIYGKATPKKLNMGVEESRTIASREKGNAIEL